MRSPTGSRCRLPRDRLRRRAVPLRLGVRNGGGTCADVLATRPPVGPAVQDLLHLRADLPAGHPGPRRAAHPRHRGGPAAGPPRYLATRYRRRGNPSTTWTRSPPLLWSWPSTAMTPPGGWRSPVRRTHHPRPAQTPPPRHRLAGPGHRHPRRRGHRPAHPAPTARRAARPTTTHPGPALLRRHEPGRDRRPDRANAGADLTPTGPNDDAATHRHARRAGLVFNLPSSREAGVTTNTPSKAPK